MVLFHSNALRVAVISRVYTRRLALTLALPSSSKNLAMIPKATARAPKEEGSIANAFSSLEGQAPIALPERFSALKKEIFKKSLVQSWKEVLTELEIVTEEIIAKGSDVSHSHHDEYHNPHARPLQIIPRIPFSDLHNGLSAEQLEDIKRTGALVVTGGVPKEVGYFSSYCCP